MTRFGTGLSFMSIKGANLVKNSQIGINTNFLFVRCRVKIADSKNYRSNYEETFHRHRADRRTDRRSAR